MYFKPLRYKICNIIYISYDDKQNILQLLILTISNYIESKTTTIVRKEIFKTVFHKNVSKYKQVAIVL